MSTFRSKVRPVFFAHANLTMELKRGRGRDKITHMHILGLRCTFFFYTNGYIVCAECSPIWLFFKRDTRD
jgi:hypothetical protein